jgi:hypothetical protein
MMHNPFSIRKGSVFYDRQWMFFSFSLLFIFFKVLKRASPFSLKRKMNQKEKSQPGAVAMN